jgi:hypothetical protein
MIYDRKTIKLKEGLFPCKLQYNCSLIRFNAKTHLVYRCQDNIRKNSWIAISELDKDLKPINHRKLQVCTETAEDPRTVVINGKLHVFYNSGCPSYPKTTFNDFSIYVAVYDADFKLLSCQPTRYRDRRDVEKNWVFFNDGTWKCIYDYKPWTILEFDDRWNGKVIYKKDIPFKWNWGELRGGTSPNYIPAEAGFGFREQKGMFYTWFHSRFLPEKSTKMPAQYVSGIISFSTEYKPLGISAMPLIYPTRPHRTAVGSHVAFPCGSIRDGDKWLVAYGSGDCNCRIDILNHKEVVSAPAFNQIEY